MLEEGTLDPAKVTRLALQNAASVSGLLLTTVFISGPQVSSSVSRLMIACVTRRIGARVRAELPIGSRA